MKEHMISINFVTSLSIDERTLLREIGLADCALHRKETKDNNIWMLESTLEQHLPVADHINYLCSLFNQNKIVIDSKILTHIYLDIGVLYDTMTCTLTLPNNLIRALTAIFPDLSIEIACYPSTNS